MKHALYILLLLISFHTLAQYVETDSRHFIRIETGYLKYFFTPVNVDASENWKGYKLPNKENGLIFNAMWGWDFNEATFLGVGAGYINFEGIDGADVFTEVNFMVSNSYINPYLGMRLGYTHLWNQYEKGSGSVLAEFLLGLQIRFGTYSYSSIHLQSGLSFTQQAVFVPLRLAYQF